MAKVSLDAGKIKSLFLLHIEKMVLALVVILLLAFVYMGYSIEGLQETPADLEEIASRSATTKMNENSWPNLAEENRPPSGHAEIVKLSDVPTPDLPYKTDKPLKPVGRNLGEKRKDPQLFPPAKVEVYAVSGPVAFRMKKEDKDPLAELKPAELKKKEVKQEPKKSRRRGGYGGETSGNYEEMMSGGSMGSMGTMGGMGSGAASRIWRGDGRRNGLWGNVRHVWCSGRSDGQRDEDPRFSPRTRCHQSALQYYRREVGGGAAQTVRRVRTRVLDRSGV